MNNNLMQKYHDTFIASLVLLLDVIKKCDINLFKLTKNNDNNIVLITIVPGININEIWNTLDENKQNDIWRYLKSTYISSARMLKEVNNLNVSDEVIK